MDDDDIRRLLSLTASEVKRIGGDEPTLLHLAEVARRRWPTDVAAVFSEEDLAGLSALVSTKAWVGDAPAIRALLEQAEDTRALLRALRESLAAALAQAAESEAETTAEPAAQPTATVKPEYGLSPASEVAWVQVEPRSVVGRAEAVAETIAALRLSRRRPVLVVGESGVGRTALLGAISKGLAEAGDARPVLRAGPAELTWRPEGVWLPLLGRVQQQSVLCVDDFDQVARLASELPNGEFLVQLAATRANEYAQLLLVCTPRAVRHLDAVFGELAVDSVRVEIPALEDSDLAAVVDSEAPALEAAHGVVLTSEARKAACTGPRSTDRRAHPGLALDRLDVAGARAQLRGLTDVPAGLVETNAHDGVTFGSAELVEALAARVKGQDEAIRTLANRLALTTASLDLHPERPDGVFLFVGPTGVGKTELSRVLADVLCGGQENLIRLDMSEYVHDWAVSRITGPAPGYVGSDNPSSWLTTRVRERPRSVVLLDEIEKASPAVWNTFLQAFDAGRLTDGRGTVADLSKVVFVMTSNLGVQQATKSAVGFGNGAGGGLRMSHEEMASRVMTVVRDRLPPELLNRLDEVIVFNALTPDDITAIAVLELERIRKRLSQRGRVVEYGAGVAEYLAEQGYDPAYGARHLQRSIERHLLAAIASTSATNVRVTVVDDRLSVG